MRNTRTGKPLEAVVRGRGMGGFLDPPGYPTHTHEIVTELNRRPHNRGALAISSVSEADWVEPVVRAQAQRLLDAWHADPPALDSDEVQDWVHQVLGYFRNCYRGEGDEPECWHAGNLRIPDEPLGDDLHAGVHHIRKFYPDFTPTPDDWEAAYWGTKPADR